MMHSAQDNVACGWVLAGSVVICALVWVHLSQCWLSVLLMGADSSMGCRYVWRPWNKDKYLGTCY